MTPGQNIYFQLVNPNGSKYTSATLAIPMSSCPSGVELSLQQLIAGIQTTHISLQPYDVGSFEPYENREKFKNRIIGADPGQIGGPLPMQMAVNDVLGLGAGTSANHPLFITVPTDGSYDFMYKLIQMNSDEIELIIETVELLKADRSIDLCTRPLRCFSRSQRSLFSLNQLIGLQPIDFPTEIHRQIQDFIDDKSSALAVLIGPTGCGKTHALMSVARSNFTMFIDAGVLSNFDRDTSVVEFENMITRTTLEWRRPNQNLPECRRIALAFILARVLFFCALMKKIPDITHFQFLVYQISYSKQIADIFSKLVHMSQQTLGEIQQLLRYTHAKDINFFWCIDEAHVLRAYLDSKIISEMPGAMQQNGDVNESFKRGILSIILFSIRTYFEASKVMFAGTSSKLRFVDNFGTFESKPVHPYVINNFVPWSSEMTIRYVTELIDIDSKSLDEVFTDWYRPRIPENFVCDILKMALNDKDSPKTQKKRRTEKESLISLKDIIDDSFKAVINRFERQVIKALADTIKKRNMQKSVVRLLITSMLSENGQSVFATFDEIESQYFADEVGAIFHADPESFRLYEGYVTRALAIEFKDDISEYHLTDAIEHLHHLIANEGKKTSSKGNSFELLCIHELLRAHWTVGSFCRALDIDTSKIPKSTQDLKFPLKITSENEDSFIRTRPNEWLRPSNKMRPDAIAFLNECSLILIGMKLFTTTVSERISQDNLLTTDDQRLYMANDGSILNTQRHAARSSLSSEAAKPVQFRLRICFLFPKAVQNFKLPENTTETIFAMVNLDNMRCIFSEHTCRLIEFICS